MSESIRHPQQAQSLSQKRSRDDLDARQPHPATTANLARTAPEANSTPALACPRSNCKRPKLDQEDMSPATSPFSHLRIDCAMAADAEQESLDSTISLRSANQQAHAKLPARSPTQLPPRSAMEPALAKRAEQARMYQKTRCLMRSQTENMSVVGLRDFERHSHVPTRPTQPLLRQRRYSIDVTTSDWSKFSIQDCAEKKNTNIKPQSPPVASVLSRSNEFEAVNPVAAGPSFPSPDRYVDFNRWSSLSPSFDDHSYLELGTATLNNDEFYYIINTQGDEQWMRDNGLDMALTVLSRDRHCEQSMIGIASSVDSQICCYPDDSGKEEYSRRFSDKRWIFMPINDGMLATENTVISGCHWALVVLDRVHHTAHYFDSLFIRKRNWQELAKQVSAGMLRLLDEDMSRWKMQVEHNSPHQFHDNLCQYDGGACGPFVYAMINELITHIQFCQFDEMEQGCNLQLDPYFPHQFGRRFNSLHTRYRMQSSIANAKSLDIADKARDEHDYIAIAGEDVVLVDVPHARFPRPPLAAGQLQSQFNCDDSTETDSTMSVSSSTISEVTELVEDND